jgi:hypothetical protein
MGKAKMETSFVQFQKCEKKELLLLCNNSKF